MREHDFGRPGADLVEGEAAALTRRCDEHAADCTMEIRDPVDAELIWRDGLSQQECEMLAFWAMKRKGHRGRIYERGEDERYPGSTYFKLSHRLRLTFWPSEKRIWFTHERRPNEKERLIMRFVDRVLRTHPPTRH